MALSFLPPDSDLTLDVVVTCDPAVKASPEQVAPIWSGDVQSLEAYEGATLFTLKALSPLSVRS
jgi:hypothetical protein